MLDKRFIRDHPDEVRRAVREKGIDLDVDELLKLDQASRELQYKVDSTQALQEELGQWARGRQRGAPGVPEKPE